MFTKIKNVILWPYYKIRDRVKLNRKLKELRKQDPFIYK